MLFSSSAISETPLSAISSTGGTKPVVVNAVLQKAATKTVTVDAVLIFVSIRTTRAGARSINSPNRPLRVTTAKVRVISEYFSDPNLLRATRTSIRTISSFYGSGTKLITVNAVLQQVSGVVRRIYWTF